MLLGYWAGVEVVVTDVVGPGPCAVHKPASFSPDHDWQLERLAETYTASGRVVTYLGDWHTHPGGAPAPSARDRRTMRRIRRSGRARQRRPLMVIVGPTPSSTPKVWCLPSGTFPRALSFTEIEVI